MYYWLVLGVHAWTPEELSQARFLFWNNVNDLAPRALQFIDNGQIKVGFDKTSGVLSYVSESKHDNSVINVRDLGREVQLSYYADPENFRPDICGAVTPWGKPWPWNPIGAGDVYHNPSHLKKLNVTATTAHITVVPLQWACKNLTCECEFEVNYSLEGKALRVTTSLRNHRTDGAAITKSHQQENPAVYTIGHLSKLYSYTGSSPWTEAPLTNFPDLDGPPNPWKPGGFKATENWAAWVNASSWGLGVYQPSTTTFLAGFHGTVGQGGPSDDNTGYVAPLQNAVLKADISYTYDFYLILDTLPNIRKFVYSKHTKQSE